MVISIIKPIRLFAISKEVQEVGAEINISDSAGRIYIDKGFAKEVIEIEKSIKVTPKQDPVKEVVKVDKPTKKAPKKAI